MQCCKRLLKEPFIIGLFLRERALYVDRLQETYPLLKEPCFINYHIISEQMSPCIIGLFCWGKSVRTPIESCIQRTLNYTKRDLSSKMPYYCRAKEPLHHRPILPGEICTYTSRVLYSKRLKLHQKGLNYTKSALSYKVPYECWANELFIINLFLRERSLCVYNVECRIQRAPYSSKRALLYKLLRLISCYTNAAQTSPLS